MMMELVDFLGKHWALSSLLFSLLFLYGVAEFIWNKDNTQISPQAAIAMINHSKAIVFDIRSAETFATGHIIDAINIPLEQFETTKQLQKYKNKPIIVVSNVSKDASKIVKNLQAQEFSQVLQLVGGMHEWTTQGLPIVTSKQKGK